MLCWFVPAGYAAEDLRVLLVLSDNNAPYQTFVNTFRQNLPVHIHTTILPVAEDFDAQQADLIVTVGVKAADRVAARSTLPMLAAMIPSNTYVDLLAKRRSARLTSAIYLDQPWARQAALLHAAMPERHRIGVLYSPGTRLDMSALRAALVEQGDTLLAKPLHNAGSLFSDMEEVLVASEVLLAVPDSAIYNSNNIRNILLSSYRRGIPLIGLSQAYVKAGALCAIFSTPEHLAEQARSVTVTFAQTRTLSAAQFPKHYTIAVNQEVARTLGLTIPSAEALRIQIEKSSGSLR
jgi:ABC-type uncharacterized transport system substrate-binding protein